MSDSDRPSDATMLLGWDPDELEAAIDEAEARGEEIDLEALAPLLPDAAWLAEEHGDDAEIEIELDDELAEKLELDLLNSPGSGEAN